ncbi:MAG: HIT family protein [Planctomycetes bacterium]|nr:HIT family protein [Planctomycetota bacterium]NOG55686.1 HIT family protein [Planctomycetota bacterium]
MSDLDHLFERIVAGEIPSHKVYENELVYAFLDINPLSRGHTLVIPKTRYERIDQLPPETAAALGRALPTVAAAVMKATGTTAYNVLCNTGRPAGQLIPHVHFHIIPKHADGSGLPHNWPAAPIDKDDAPALCQAIVDAMPTA